MRVELLTIGDELLVGQTVNTNAAWLGGRLTGIGANVQRIVAVGDDEQQIHRELDRSLASADVVIITGGLGPTHDDLTREALAAYFRLDLVFDEATWQRIVARFTARGLTPVESNRKQATAPQGFELLDNRLGTAPGLWFDTDDNNVVVVLPGVPRELHILMDEQVLPRLRQRHDLVVIEQRLVRTAGIAESSLQEEIGDLSEWVDGSTLRLAYQAGTDGVRLRLTATETTRDRALRCLDHVEGVLRQRIGEHIYATGEETLEQVAGRSLRERQLTLATAESCTGGLLASRVTDVPGSSAYFRGGVAAYSNEAKITLLGVDEEELINHGAVSQTVAEQMAHGARRRFQADLGVAITGIAGPSGGTAEKPVGTVWVAIAHAEGEEARRYQLTQERIFNKEMSCTLALDRIRRYLHRSHPVVT